MASDAPAPLPRFFVMKKRLGGTHDSGFSMVEQNVGPAHRCPQCGDLIGMLTWQPPYKVELELHGQDFGDLLEGPGGNVLVTERFAEDFQAEGLTGLSGFHPVEVMGVRRKRRGPPPGSPPRYLFVTPVFDRPAVDVERSRFRITQPMVCTGCRSIGVDAIDGFALEAGTWSGEDVFRPRGLWGVMVVSERFMRFAERHALSHMTLVPIEKYVWDPLGHYSPPSPGTTDRN